MEQNKRNDVQAQAIGAVLMKVLKRFKIDDSLSCSGISRNWKDIVGNAISAHSKPVNLVKGCLYVNVDSSIWLNELNLYMKNDILKKIQAIHKNVKDIRFKIGPV